MHRVEVALRQLVGWLFALLWFRSSSRPRALLTSSRRVVVVRIDNRVGEALLTTPLIDALAKTHEVHLVVHPKCVRVLEGLPGLAGLHPFERRWLWWPWRAELRALRTLCTDAVVVNAASWVEFSGTPALVSRWLGARGCVVGPTVGASKRLMDVAVPPRTDTTNEVAQRVHFLSPLLDAPSGALRFRTPRPSPAVDALVAATPSFAVLNPGGRLGERRVPPAVFSLVAQALEQRGVRAVITWGPGEQALADEVLTAGAGVLAPPTSLDDLAFLMSKATVVVCNNTGPMHLSVAVGARTIALFWKMPVEQWGHPHAPHLMLDLTGLDGPTAMAAKVVAAL